MVYRYPPWKPDFATDSESDFGIGYLTAQFGTHIFPWFHRKDNSSLNQQDDWTALTEPDYDAGASEVQSVGQIFSGVYKNHFRHEKVVVSS